MTLDLAFDPSTLTVPLASSVDASAWREGWRIPDPLNVSQWADEYRWLTREGAAEPGRWSTSRMPFLGRIMDVLSDDHPCKKASLCKSTQTGGTEVLNNFVGYIMHFSPGPTMVVMPTEKLAQRWSNQRLKPMIAASQALREIISPARSRDASNTTLMKEFPGGFLVIAGANSSSDLRSMPARRVCVDEVEENPEDLDDQGRPDELAERRASTFVRRKIFKVSSPKLKATSVIWGEYEAGTQETYHVPCPHCGYKQPLVIEQLLPDGTYLCEDGACGKIIEEHHKTWMLDPANGAAWVAKHPERENEHCSFHINALYAAHGLGYTWKEIAILREEAQRKPEKQVTFTNTILGLPFEGERQQQDAGEVESRAELGVMRGIVPRGRYILTVGVDCQHDRFELQVVAWGRGERASIVDYQVIDGDPSQQDGYAELEVELKRSYANLNGYQLLPVAVAIDGGNWTEEVAKFVRRQGAMQQNVVRRVLTVGGLPQTQTLHVVRGRSSKSERVVYRPKKAEVNSRGKTIARSVGVWGVGTDVAKHILFGRMGADAHVEDVEDRMIRFPGGRERTGPEDHQAEATYLPPGYYTGLTCEFYDMTARKWVTPRHARNEPLDTLVYAYWAALSPAVRLDLKREHEWDALQKMLEPERDLLSAVTPNAEAPVPRETNYSHLASHESAPRKVARGARHAGVA
jgi:phage terminase large subunit GpA-like protein